MSLFIYNPTAEIAIANGTNSFTPPTRLQKFEEDIAFNYITSISENNYYESYYPWSESQIEFNNIFKPLKDAGLINNLRSYIHWTDEQKLFFSRLTDIELQKTIKLLQTHKINIPYSGIKATSMQEIEHQIIQWGSVVIKQPWSTSGRGIHFVDNNNKKLDKAWILGSFKRQGFVTVEPFMNKVLDFSLHFNINQKEVKNIGISYSVNNRKGSFIGGNINRKKIKTNIQNKLTHFIEANINYKLFYIVKKAIVINDIHKKYTGVVGIDGIVYQDKNNELFIHPCVDVNMRYNMGLLNIKLSDYVSRTSKAIWRIENFNKNNWSEFITYNQNKYPLKIRNKKIVSGFIPLTPKSNNALFGAWMMVSGA